MNIHKMKGTIYMPWLLEIPECWVCKRIEELIKEDPTNEKLKSMRAKKIGHIKSDKNEK